MTPADSFEQLLERMGACKRRRKTLECPTRKGTEIIEIFRWQWVVSVQRPREACDSRDASRVHQSGATRNANGLVFTLEVVILRSMLATTDDEIQRATQQIAAALGETHHGPVAQIERLVRLLGVEWAQTVVRETLATQAQGGLTLPDGSRRRTVGGTFFYLARQRMTSEQAALVFPRRMQPQAQPVPREPMGWGERLDAVREAGREKGKVMSVRITVTGRPCSVVRREGTVVLTMEDNHESSLPRTVPVPPAEPTLYIVYVAARQWAAVEPALQNPNDVLIVQGTCAYDEAAQGIAVFAASVTTKLTKIANQRGLGASGRKPLGAGARPGRERDEARRPGPKPASVAPKPEPLPTKYTVGQRVQHPQFGAGVVVESQVIHGDEEVVVEFEVSGRRRLSTSATKLEVVE